MSTPSNFYAEKILAQHPLGMWSLDDESSYLTKINEAGRQLSTWTQTGGTATSGYDSSAPFPLSYTTTITGTATPSYAADAKVYLSSASAFSSNTFTISFYLKTQYVCSVYAGYGSGNVRNISGVTWNVSYLEFTTSSSHGFSAGEYVEVSGVSPDIYDGSGVVSATGLTSTKFRLYTSRPNQGAGSGGQVSGGKTQSKFINPADYPTNSWIPISFTFDDNVTSQNILISFSYSQTSPQFFVNGLTVGKDSQPFNGESLGQTSISIPANISTTLTNAIETKSYGTQEYSAYYVCDSNNVYAKNSGTSMCYGSNTSTRIYPYTTPGQPSFIFPAFGMLNETGRYKGLTLQTLIRITANNSVPKKIMGPLASTDGVYVTKDIISLKIGNSIDSFPLSEMYRPMVMQLKIGNGFAKLSIDGEEIISLQIDNSALVLPARLDGSSKSQDWFGVYAYTDIPLIEIGSLAIYPYESSDAMAKLNFVYAQAVSIPTISNSSFGQTISPDFALANYVNNYNYPSFQAKWEQATILENLDILENDALSAKEFQKPGTVTSLYDSEKLFLDVYETYVASGETNTFINLKPSTVVAASGRSWTTNQGYLSANLSGENDYLSSCIYGVFKSLESSGTEQILLKITNMLNNDYFQVSIINTTIYYKYKYANGSEIEIARKSITQNVTFAVGFDVQKLINSNTELASFFSNKTNLQFFVAGQSALTNTFSGNIYKVGLSSLRNSADILSLFDVGGTVAINTQTPTYSAPNITLTTASAHGFSVGQKVEIVGVTPLGYNGVWTTQTGTTASTLVVNIGSNPGAITVIGSVTGTAGILSDSTSFASLLSKTASYSIYGLNAFGKITLDAGTTGYWQDYVPLSKLAKTVVNELGNKATSLDFIQINLDYEEPRTYSSGNFVTSGLPIRGYVTFQTLASGANKDLTTFGTTVAASATRMINASTFSATTKYEFVNGMIIYPPTNVDISTLAIVLHLDISTEASLTKPIRTRFIQLGAQSFNKNMPNKLGTKYAMDVYPYAYDAQGSNTAPTYPYNYNIQNPYLIYKQANPHLYLTRHSGFRIIGTLPTAYHRGVYAKLGDFSPDKQITSLQMAILSDFESFSGSSKTIFSIKTNSGEMRFYTGVVAGSTTKAEILTDSSIPVIYYLNGRKVGTPVINVNEWNVLGISFVEPLDVSNSQGTIFVRSDILVNDISCHYADAAEIAQKSSPLLWSQIDDNKWRIPVPTQTPTRVANSITLNTTGNHNLVVGEVLTFYDIQPSSYGVGFGGGTLKISKRDSDTSFTYENAYAVTSPITTAGTVAGTWQYSSIPNYYSLYGSSPDTIYDQFVGRNKVVIDIQDDSPVMQLNQYQYLAYVDVKTDTFILDVK